MALTPNAPFTITFLPDPPPSKIDNTKKNPGPADGKSRAGYTKFTVKPKATVSTAGGPVAKDSTRQFWFEDVLIEFFLKDFIIEISSDYKPGSCPYRVTCDHELESHVRRPTKLFLDCRDKVIQKINQISLPTKQSPKTIPQGQEDATESTLMAPVAAAIKELNKQIGEMLDKDRIDQDSDANYRPIYARCRPEEWATKK